MEGKLQLTIIHNVERLNAFISKNKDKARVIVFATKIARLSSFATFIQPCNVSSATIKRRKEEKKKGRKQGRKEFRKKRRKERYLDSKGRNRTLELLIGRNCM